MPMVYRSFALVGAAAVLAVAVCTATGAQEENAVAAMDKPLDQFTIGDLFPSLSSAGLQETGTTWQSWGQEVANATAKQMASIEAAIPKVKLMSGQARDAAKTAEKNKDFSTSGAAEGRMKTADVVLKVLDGLEGVTKRQVAVGKAAVAAGAAMLKLNEVDGGLEPFRTKGISRPDKEGDPDNRLDASGVRALKQQAEAIKDLAKSLSEAASAMNSLASERLNFISSLEKAGHVQPLPGK